MDGAPTLLALPTDRPRPPLQRHAGAHRRLSLDRSLADGLIEAARPQGATFFMAAAGTPMRTLQEWMGHRDIETTQRYADYAPSEHEAGWS